MNSAWPSWKKYSTYSINTDDIPNYIRNIFTTEHKEATSGGWRLYLTQSLEASYVNLSLAHFHQNPKIYFIFLFIFVEFRSEIY